MSGPFVRPSELVAPIADSDSHEVEGFRMKEQP